MSQQTDLLREIAAVTSQGGASDRISDWFTEDFRLHEPGKPALPVGHEGASQMRSFLRTLKPPIEVEILDMIEEGDRVAVRWQVTATYYDGQPSIVLRTAASRRSGASRSRHFGPEDAARTQMFGSDHTFERDGG